MNDRIKTRITTSSAWKQQRVKPKEYPRTPQHEAAATRFWTFTSFAMTLNVTAYLRSGIGDDPASLAQRDPSLGMLALRCLKDRAGKLWSERTRKYSLYPLAVVRLAEFDQIGKIFW